MITGWPSSPGEVLGEGRLAAAGRADHHHVLMTLADEAENFFQLLVRALRRAVRSVGKPDFNRPGEPGCGDFRRDNLAVIFFANRVFGEMLVDCIREQFENLAV